MSDATRGAVLVCGGAGYIGSHMCKQLARAGYLPVTFDNLSTGHRHAVRWGPLEEGDLLDPPRLAEVLASRPFEAVMHFAARSLVGESMVEPGMYFRNNVTGTMNLLEAMRSASVGRLVFSSTAAVYGSPKYTPIDERHPTEPLNPYGWSKLQAERVIEEHCRAHGCSAVALRYFNAAGADEQLEAGEDHYPETHLIPNILRAGLVPGAKPLSIYGTDYPTPDGTCVRDYVHVHDLCAAHLAALERMDSNAGFAVFNLGSGRGFTVREVLAACNRHLANPVPATFAERRPGDPAYLVASAARAGEALGWKASRSLEDIIYTASRWHGRAR